jgi:hypothetical protein
VGEGVLLVLGESALDGLDLEPGDLDVLLVEQSSRHNKSIYA